jgi:hypothetical protein
VLESEMVQVFGLARGRSAYSFANVHDDKVLDKIRKLYLVVYGKPTMPKSLVKISQNVTIPFTITCDL